MTEDRSVLSRPAPPPALAVRYGDEPEQVADAWPAGGRAAERPLVVLVHGGFWRPGYDRTHLGPMAAALRAKGLTVARVEYRRLPGCPEAAVGDVRRALRLVPGALAAAGARHSGASVVVGHSAGGHLALCAASRPAPGLVGALALAAVADLRLAHDLGLGDGAVADFLGGPPDGAAALDPPRLPAPGVPVVLVHGTGDATVPIALCEAYAAAHPVARTVPVPGAGHFALIDPLSAAWPAVVAELLALCRA
jgi:acetyl esterase/lipase